MKILIVHNKYRLRSGEERVVENESRLLRENGHNVEIFFLDNRDITNFYSKLKTSIFSFYNPRSAKMIRKKISEFNPDVIHVHNIFPLISTAVFFRNVRKNIPVVLTLHNYRLICANAILLRNNKTCTKCVEKRFPFYGMIYRCYRNSFFKTLVLVLMTSIHRLSGTWKKRVDRYIVLTDFHKNTLLNSNLNLKGDQIVVKPNFSFNKGSVKKDKKDYYIFLGRLELDKGVETMLRAFQGTEYKLYIYGDGSLKDTVQEVCSQNDNMVYGGLKDPEYVLEKLRYAKGLIFPSINFEGFPMVIAEAFSCGTPVISTDIGSQGEIVKHGYNGLHFKMNDPDDLRDKVEMLSEMDIDSMINNARDSYEKFYNDKVNYKLLITIYKNLLDQLR